MRPAQHAGCKGNSSAPAVHVPSNARAAGWVGAGQGGTGQGQRWGSQAGVIRHHIDAAHHTCKHRRRAAGSE